MANDDLRMSCRPLFCAVCRAATDTNPVLTTMYMHYVRRPKGRLLGACPYQHMPPLIYIARLPYGSKGKVAATIALRIQVSLGLVC